MKGSPVRVRASALEKHLQRAIFREPRTREGFAETDSMGSVMEAPSRISSARDRHRGSRALKFTSVQRAKTALYGAGQTPKGGLLEALWKPADRAMLKRSPSRRIARVLPPAKCRARPGCASGMLSGS